MLNSYVFDSFGNEAASTGSFANPFIYTGREVDAETGLRYFRARYYDGNIGRFISEDPIGSRSRRPNFYLYGKNEPTLFNDPTGLVAEEAQKETPQQIFQDAENEALRRLKDPTCAAAFPGRNPCKAIRDTHYRRMPPEAVKVRGGWMAATISPTLVYINRDSGFYNYVPGTNYQTVDPIEHTAYNVPAGAVENALTLLHELEHQLGIGIHDAPNGTVDPLAELANDLYILRHCFSDVRVPLH